MNDEVLFVWGPDEEDSRIGRSSLESGKMKFKHLVDFVTMTATQPATDGTFCKAIDNGLFK